MLCSYLFRENTISKNIMLYARSYQYFLLVCAIKVKVKVLFGYIPN